MAYKVRGWLKAMDSKSLKLFISVAQLQSVSQAAQAQHLSQSAVSKRIAQLESELDTQLFERHNRRLSLTHAGNILLSRAQKLLDLLDNTKQELSDLNNEVSGHISVAASHHIGLHRLPPALSTLKKKHPKIELELKFMGSEQASLAIENRQVDFALATLSNHCNKLFEQKKLWHDELIPVCDHQHPLTSKSHISLKTLCEYTAILPERNTTTFNLVNEVFLQQQLSLKLAMATNYLETIKMMVSVGLGWSYLPQNMVDNKLKSLKVIGKNPSRNLGILKLKSRNLSRAAQAFIGLLEKT